MDVGNWVILSILLGYNFRACVLYMLAGVGETKNCGLSTILLEHSETLRYCYAEGDVFEVSV
jgi:hypothetical protein